MKRILFFILSSFIIHESFCQLEFRNSNVGRLINLEDFNGHSLLKKYDPDISGSPFINADWTPANIILSKGKAIGPLLVKLNIESNKLYFIDTAGKELIAAEGTVKKIDLSLTIIQKIVPSIFSKVVTPILTSKMKIIFTRFLQKVKLNYWQKNLNISGQLKMNFQVKL